MGSIQPISYRNIKFDQKNNNLPLEGSERGDLLKFGDCSIVVITFLKASLVGICPVCPVRTK